MKAVTIAHVSDLHLPFEPQLSAAQWVSKRALSAWAWRRRRLVHRAQIIAALAAELRERDIDHIVITGDLVNFSLPEEFDRARAWLEALVPADCISVVPGNHDALVPVAEQDGLGRWAAWTRTDGGWPFVHRRHGLALIGINSGFPTAPLLARGHIGAGQLARLEDVLNEEAVAGRVRIVLVHHPVADRAVSWRRALSDRASLRAVLQRAGAELVLHGHARSARFDALPGPPGTLGMIPCLSVPSSSALPNPHDVPARWHRLRFFGAPDKVAVTMRAWSVEEGGFTDAGGYELCLPRRAPDADRGYRPAAEKSTRAGAAA
jgi:3',5'-cyclic AMP phosphodiesterase CpdA